MPWFGGDNCQNVGTTKKECDGCYPSKAGSPIVVKITRPVNTNYGNRFASNRGDCCAKCNNRDNVNKMVFNQNAIVNFDRINRINDARSNNINPGDMTFSPSTPGAKPEKRKCDNCLKILREKELQLLKKEQEILKIKTHFTTLNKTGKESGLGTNCEHCFKALREKEFELFRKEQEIAKMRMAAAKNPIDTKAKVDKAKCANCFKALRQKELELIKKEHALMKNMTRPNINVKNFNYCSCCRDNKKSSVNKAKADEETRKKNRDNCFKALRMKEIRLLEKEKEIQKKIQRFREESIAKAKQDLEKVPDPRLVVSDKDKVIKCVCSCSSAERLKASKPPPRSCSARCCAMKLAANLLCYLVRPTGSKKEHKGPCSMRFLPWCRPGHLESAPYKCCTILGGSDKEPKIKKRRLLQEQKQNQNQKQEQKFPLFKKSVSALEEVQAGKKDMPKADADYRVKTIGQIRPGKIKSMFTPKPDVVEAEVRRAYGPKGLETYRAKMSESPTRAAKGSTTKLAKVSTTGVPQESQVATTTVARGFGTNMVGKLKSKVSETALPIRLKSKTTKTFETKVIDQETKPSKKLKTREDSGKPSKKLKTREDSGKPSKKLKTREDSGETVSRKYKTKVKDGDTLVGPKTSKSEEKYERKLPKKYRTAKADVEYEGRRTPRSVYDDQVEWVMSGSTEKVKRPIPWLPERPPCPEFMKVLGRILVYFTGCFFGIPCGLFLCLCLLCTSCSD